MVESIKVPKLTEPSSRRCWLPSQSLTWNLKMAPWNRRFLLAYIGLSLGSVAWVKHFLGSKLVRSPRMLTCCLPCHSCGTSMAVQHIPTWFIPTPNKIGFLLENFPKEDTSGNSPLIWIKSSWPKVYFVVRDLIMGIQGIVKGSSCLITP